MERVRPLILLLSAAALAAAGCAAAERTVATSYRQMKEAAGVASSGPASQVLCFWQRRLVTLPDPTKDGQSVPGLVGQMFLITSDNQPADVTGSLTIAMDDVTPRPPGHPPQTREVFHYTQQVLNQLATQDERFGKSYALYLMWPAEWRDVTAVAINVRYDSPNGPVLNANEAQLVIETGGPGTPVRLDGSNAIGRRTADPTWVTTRGVPDPNRLMAAMQGPPPATAPPPASTPLPQPRQVAPPLAGTGPNATTVFGGPPNPAVAFPKPVLVNPGTGQTSPLPPAAFPPVLGQPQQQPQAPAVLPPPTTTPWPGLQQPQTPAVLPPPTLPGQPSVPQQPMTTVIPRVGI